MVSKLEIYALQNLSDEFVVPKGVLLTFTLKHVNDMVAKSICNLSVFAHFADDLNWHHVVRTMTMSEAMLERFANHLDWDLVAEHQHLSEAFIASHTDDLDWNIVVEHQQLSFDLVQYIIGGTDPYYFFSGFFSQHQYLWGEDQFDDYIDDYPEIWRTQHLSEQFIEANIDRVNWMELSEAQRQWSDEFFSRYYAEFDKPLLVRNAILNETQIDRLFADGYYTAVFQVLSDAIIRKYSTNLRWALIAAHQTLEPARIAQIQAMEDWSDAEKAAFSEGVKDFEKVKQFPLLCDWAILSRTVPESILVENESKVVWTSVFLESPSDTFLAAYHGRLEPLYVSCRASEQFLSSHPTYIIPMALQENRRIFSMSFLAKYINVFGVQRVANFPGLSVNMRRKIENQ